AAWNAAMKLFESQNYEAAAASFTTLAPDFLALKDINSSAILYHHLGDCYSSLGNYQMASACYLRESDFWAMAGKNDETIDSKRRSNLISTSHRLYIETDDKTYSAGKYFRADYEPSNGIILGAYAEGDSNIHDPYVKDKFYMDTFPSLVGKEHGAYLLYLPYGDDILGYASHLKRAKDLGLILQISLEPHDGLEMVKDNDPYLITLAKNMENSGVKLMLRFAGEMNDTTGQWYTTNYELFKEKFRIVSKIFHVYAPSVPVIWSPNFYPENNIENYYPGDEYVDYVGVSSYKFHQPETDPLGKGVDRSRWSSQLDTIYSLYGDKKPIIISEGSASYMDYNTGEDITDFACKQLYDFYAYLPIKYPNVKMVFIFDSDRERQKFCLSKNQKFLETYKKAISNDSYLDGLNPEKTNNEYYELSNNVTVSAKKADVCSYIQYPDDSAAYVSYFINGESKGSSYEIPYNVNIDFSNYKGQTVKLKADSYSKEGKLLTESEITIKVE
ncbi:MAG: glycosyl hydrolase, partial [Bacillota bacterium]|nr:glycosyl hydrolase [Bacillota bacterium]